MEFTEKCQQQPHSNRERTVSTMTRYDTLLQNMTRTIFSLSILKMLSQATNNTVTQPCADWALGSGTCSLDWRILCTLWDWRMSIYIIYIFTYTFLCIYLIMKLYNYTCSYQYIYIYIHLSVCVCVSSTFIHRHIGYSYLLFRHHSQAFSSSLSSSL